MNALCIIHQAELSSVFLLPRYPSALLSTMHSLLRLNVSPNFIDHGHTPPFPIFSSGKRHDGGAKTYTTFEVFLCMTMYYARPFLHFSKYLPLSQSVILNAYLVTHSYLEFIQLSPLPTCCILSHPIALLSPLTPSSVSFLILRLDLFRGSLPSPGDLCSVWIDGVSRSH